jgi:hypothetical protein
MKRAMCLMMVCGIAACGSAQRRGEDLFESIRTYHEGVRWERFPAAASRVPAPQRAAFVEERDRLAEDLRITDYDVVRVTPGERTAQVQVKYTWYKDSEGLVRRTHALERWQRSGKVWVLVDEHRMRGDDMPGLSEPEDGDEADGGDRGQGSHADHDSDDGDSGGRRVAAPGADVKAAGGGSDGSSSADRDPAP